MSMVGYVGTTGMDGAVDYFLCDEMVWYEPGPHLETARRQPV